MQPKPRALSALPSSRASSTAFFGASASAIERIKLLPSAPVAVRNRSPKCSLCGVEFVIPVVIGPSGFAGAFTALQKDNMQRHVKTQIMDGARRAADRWGLSWKQDIV